MAPLVKALRGLRNVETVLLHTGQHYDSTMSACFIEELGLPQPEVNLQTGSGSHAEQTAHMLLGYEDALKKYEPDLVLAQGDTNSVLSAGLATVKLRIPFGHVESGLRSFDRSMPEEINRVLADDCSNLCFAPTVNASLNLLAEGIQPPRIFLTGNTIVDACQQHLGIALARAHVLRDLHLNDGTPFITMTLHRAENTDDAEKLHRLVATLERLKGTPVVFPVHPRARAVLQAHHLWDRMEAMDHVHLLEPLPYLEFLSLLWNSKVVLTDSGGVQEEGLTLGVPCITLRENTERPETLQLGDSTLVGMDMEAILRMVNEFLREPPIPHRLFLEGNPLGDGRAGERIAAISVEEVREGFAPSHRTTSATGLVPREEVSFPVGIHGDRLSTVRALYPKSLILAVIDPRGKRLIPYHDLPLGQDWQVVMLAAREDQERLKVLTSFMELP